MNALLVIHEKILKTKTVKNLQKIFLKFCQTANFELKCNLSYGFQQSKQSKNIKNEDFKNTLSLPSLYKNADKLNLAICFEN